MIKVNAEELRNALEIVKPCMSKDKARPLLMGIGIYQKGDRLVLTTCDGVRHVSTSIQIIEGKLDNEFIVEYQKLPKQPDHFVIDIQIIKMELDSVLKLTYPNQFVTLKLISQEIERLVKPDSIMPRGYDDGEHFTIHFNARLIHEMFRALPKDGKDQGVILTFGKGHLDPMRFTSIENPTVVGLILPLRP